MNRLKSYGNFKRPIEQPGVKYIYSSRFNFVSLEKIEAKLVYHLDCWKVFPRVGKIFVTLDAIQGERTRIKCFGVYFCLKEAKIMTKHEASDYVEL